MESNLEKEIGNDAMGVEEAPRPSHRIVFGSCYNPNRGDDMWDLIRQFSPNQLLLLGDQVYADFHPKTGIWQRSNPEIIRREYEKFFSMAGWKSLVSSLSHGWISVYDDHDYGINNGDKTWKYRKEAMELFREFNKDHFQPILYEDDNGNAIMDGVYSSKDFSVPLNDGKVLKYTVILLDSRSSKDPTGTSHGDFLGERQWKWLEQELERASGVANMILLGSAIQVIPNGKLLEETWSEFPEQREKLLSLVTKASLRTNIVILSGDIHSAEISQTNCYATLKPKSNGESIIQVIPRRLIELTSSGLSHTFIHRMDVNKVFAVSKQKKIERALKSESNEPIPFYNHLPSLIYSRGIIAELLFNVYQIASPSSNRENRFSDIYPNLHFGTLDFYSLSQTQGISGLKISEMDKNYDGMNRLWENSLAELEWQTINYEGKSVMRKRISIYDTLPSSKYINFNGSSLLLDDWDIANVRCINIQGEVPLWRTVLERMTLSAFIMICFIIPICWILWFVCASIFYLSWGREMKRRQAIEDRYQQRDKPKQH